MLVSVLCCVVDPGELRVMFFWLCGSWLKGNPREIWYRVQFPQWQKRPPASVPQSFNGTLHTGKAASIHLARHSQRKFKWISKTEARSARPTWVSSSALKQTTIEESVVERMILVVTYLPTIPREYPVPCWLQEEPKSNFYFVLRSSTRCWPPSYIL